MSGPRPVVGELPETQSPRSHPDLQNRRPHLSDGGLCPGSWDRKVLGCGLCGPERMWGWEWGTPVLCPTGWTATAPDRPISCRSLLWFLSHTAQMTGQCLVHTGTYMLRVLADTEERAMPSPRPRGGITSG